MPLAIPRGPLTPQQVDQRLATGQRRSGEFVYGTRCPQCRACIPVRLNVDRFRPNATQRRIWRRGLSALRIETGPLVVDQVRIDLFNRHRQERNLDRGRQVDSEDYHWGFVRTCFDSFEMSYYFEDRLVAVAICDQGAESISAVYTYFDPDFSRYSPGIFSILNQVEYVRRTARRYLYLGFFIAESVHMSYKQQFKPQEQFIRGSWQEV
jgi:arginine-tRNA-protein transferase